MKTNKRHYTLHQKTDAIRKYFKYCPNDLTTIINIIYIKEMGFFVTNPLSNVAFRICKEILKHDKYAVNDDDCENNTALHLACINGHSR